MNKLIERVVKVPTPTKIAVVGAAVALLTAVNWYLVISPLDESIAAKHAEINRLERDLVDKKVIADNLNQFRREKEELERKFSEAKAELPTEAALDELLRQLNDVGKKSGLDIVNLEPGADVPANFYASIPIKMSVSGSYHEIALFFDAVAKLRRIVNVSKIVFSSPTRKNEKVVLGANFVATTFRFIEGKDAPAEQGKGGKSKAKGKK